MANSSIVLVGLGSSWALPGVYIQLSFAQGPVAGNSAPRSVLLLGNRTSAGVATVDTVVYGPTTPVPCQTEADVINLFGAGSQLHRMFLRFLKAAGPNNTTPLYFLAVTASAGTAASLTETIATAALSAGTHRTWCGDQFVDTPITLGDSAITIATNIVASVVSQTNWPVTAANSGTAIVTYTAKIKGPEGNWIRLQALITPGTATIGTTTTLTANTFMTSGATADSNAAALSTIAGTRYYYIVSGDSDSTNLAALVTQVSSQANPTTGIRQRVISGFMDTLANAITQATTINNPRAEIVWGASTDCQPSELAAGAAGIYSTLEQGSPAGVARKNYSGFPNSPTDAAYWPFIAGRNGVAGAPTAVQANSAITNGLTPITVLATGAAQLVKRCTSYSLNGSVQDPRVRDAHRVSVCDYWCDDVQAVTQLQFGGKDLLPDPVQGQPAVPATAVTPRIWGNAIKNVTNNYQSAGQWSFPPGVTAQPGQSPGDVINANMIGPQIETNPVDRMSVEVGLSVVNLFDQAAVLANQVG